MWLWQPKQKSYVLNVFVPESTCLRLSNDNTMNTAWHLLCKQSVVLQKNGWKNWDVPPRLYPRHILYWRKVSVLDYHLMYLCYSKGLYSPLYGPSNLYNTAILAKNMRFWPYTPFSGLGRNFCEKIAFLTIFWPENVFLPSKSIFSHAEMFFLHFEWLL